MLIHAPRRATTPEEQEPRRRLSRRAGRRAADACRKLRPSGVHLTTIRGYPAGRVLISSSQAGTDWLDRWTRTSQALDGLLPPIALADPG